MKKILLKLLLTLPLIVLLTTNAFALEDEEFINQQYENSEAFELIDDLPNETQEMLSSLGVDQVEFSKISNISFKNIIEMMKEIIHGEIKNPFRFLFAMTGVLILIAIAKTIVSTENNEAIDLACSLFFIIAIMSSMISYSTYIISAIDLSHKFMLSFIPIFTAFIAVSGNPASALNYNTVAMILSQSASSFTTSFLVPLVVMFVALSISASISPALNMGELLEMLKKSITWLLTAICTIFTGFLTIKGILASSADTVAAKSGKALIGALIPIIGSSLSDSYSSILGSMSMLKNTIGVFGILVVALINIPVLVQALLWIISIYLTAFVAESMGQKNCAQLLKNINSTNIILVAILIFNLVLIMVSTAIVMVFKATI